MSRWEPKRLEPIENELCDEVWVHIGKEDVFPMWSALTDVLWETIRRQPLDDLRYVFRGYLIRSLSVGL